MSENLGSSQMLPNLLIVSGSQIDHKFTYTNGQARVLQSAWNCNALNSSFAVPNTDVWLFLPPNFTLTEDVNLEELIALFLGKQDYKCLYGDFNVCWETDSGPVVIQQFLHTIDQELVSKDYVIESPFICYGVDQPIFSDEQFPLWSALKLLSKNTLIYHLKKFITEQTIRQVKWQTPEKT